MTQIKIEGEQFVRDMNSKALLSTDKKAVSEYQAKRAMMRKMNDLNSMKEQVNQLLTLRDEVAELKTMLRNALNCKVSN
jgi:hypothetical protein